MIGEDLRAEIRRLFFAEHWKIGTIAAELGVHHETVRRALEVDRFVSRGQHRPSALDPHLAFIAETLEQHPRLRATRVHEMLVARGYEGSVVQTRRAVRRLRPRPKGEAYLRLATLPGEQAQVDWGHFGHLTIGRARRPLMAFVLVLSWSRAMHVRFTLDSTLECLVRGHVTAFEELGGVPRMLLYDNPKTVVLGRRGTRVEFHSRLLELASHYHFEPRAVGVRRGNEKGRVERQIRFLRDRFFAARRFRDIDDLNAQYLEWRDAWAHARPCPGDETLTVAQALEKERELLLPLPEHPLSADKVVTVTAGKTPYVRFDRNDYSVPHELARRSLTLVASEHEVRVLDGGTEVARHRRSYGKGEQVEDERHIEGLVAAKRAARNARGRDRLAATVPGADTLLTEAMHRGHDLPNATRQMVRLLDDYGDGALAAAVAEALERDTPTPSAVAWLLEQRRRRKGQPPPVNVALPDRPEVRDLRVTPHDLEDYDALAERDEDDTS